MARARRLPSLNGLRAFEATGRHLSFTKAAEELNVTQTAVSHQIKGLEAQLGLKLFHRSPGRVELTREGRLLLPGLTEAFDRMTQAVEDVRPASDGRPLIVSVTPAFGSKWLAGRLGRFWRQHPEVELVIQHTMSLVGLTRDEVDVAVRFGDGDWPGLVAEKLVAKDMVPLCSPALLESAHPLRTPADLKHYTLLHEDDQEDWVEWLRIAGVTDIDPR
ncbi:MAG: LysR family transcriptional regulator, partial [Cytophagales bacterium]|nr:LysR family transcriptional regulator [Cytophagales bacterium]